jgi:methylmalonyl-CoA mutase cobalamin-binding domain/chain
MAVVAPSRLARPATSASRRIVTAVPLCDGHDSAITTINQELVRHGWEVVYLGYHQAASAIARAAVQEDARAVGISSYNGGHLVFFREVLAQLRARGGADIAVFGGGGGTITAADERVMRRAGVDRIFFAGTPLDEMMADIARDYTGPLPAKPSLEGDRALGRAITLLENSAGRGSKPSTRRRSPRRQSPLRNTFVVGVAGPGGAGKSTLIDELAARFLRSPASGRLAILANDPSHPDSGGATLGDRVSAIYAQDDRVFFRSLATRGSLTGVAHATPAVVDLLRRSGEFDLIFVESVGIGQESDPFGSFDRARSFVDAVLFVVPPHYGGRIQLQKIGLLNGADLVALNKCDDRRATTAKIELTARLAANGRNQPLHTTIAARHDDPGVDALSAAIESLRRGSGLWPAPESSRRREPSATS